MAIPAVDPGTVGPDPAGIGTITPSQNKVTIKGAVVLVEGDIVSAHTSGSNTHPAQPIPASACSTKMTIGGKRVALMGGTVSCGGTITATSAVGFTVSS